MTAAEIPPGPAPDLPAELDRAIDASFLTSYRAAMRMSAALVLASAATAAFLIR